MITNISALSRANFPRLMHLSLCKSIKNIDRNKIITIENILNGFWPLLANFNLRSNFNFVNIRPFLKTNLK